MKNILKYGLGIGVLFGAYSLFIGLLELGENVFPIAAILIPIAGLYLGTKKIAKDDFSGKAAFSDLFQKGLLILGVAALVNVVFFFINYEIIHTDYVAQQSASIRSDLEAEGMSEQEILDALKISELFFGTPLKYVSAIWPFALIGLVFSPIFSFFLRGK